jgi:hypothetical protein
LAGTACNSSLFLLLYNPVQEEFLLASCYFEQTADFFRGDNREGVEARNEVSELHQACLSRNIYFFCKIFPMLFQVAALAMEDMLSWMQEGGQVGH